MKLSELMRQYCYGATGQTIEKWCAEVVLLEDRIGAAEKKVEAYANTCRVVAGWLEEKAGWRDGGPNNDELNALHSGDPIPDDNLAILSGKPDKARPR